MVKALYEDNDFFRKCLKKSVSRNIHKQKRLILLNLNELLRTSNSNMSLLALGFQNFVNCIQYDVFLMDYLVFIQCVCIFHQNMKLLLAPLNFAYQDLFRLIVRDINNK